MVDEKALVRAVKRAMENAGTLPAKQAVKLVPADWHRICDLVLNPPQALSPGSTGETEGWRDIESAPKDGSSFLAVVWGQVRAIKWCAAWEIWFDDSVDFDTVDYENDEMFGIGALVPTHWRPLPAPPSAMLSAGCRRAVVSEDGRGVEAPSVTSAAGERG